MTTETEQTVDQRFSMGPRPELSVSNVSGRISIHATDGSEIVVRANKRGSSRSRGNTQVDVRRDGNKVSVQTRSGAVGLVNFGRSSAVDYDIQVPRECLIRVHGVSSDVDVEGTRADLGVQTVSGDVQVRDVAGDLTMTTVSGDVVAADLSGTLVARTTSGDGRILHSRLRRFSVNSVSGDFTLESPLLADEHCHAKTVSGDLELLVPPDTGATIQLKSVSGSVACELPAEIIKSGRRHWQGRINGGGGHVEMNSVSGDLRIRRAGSKATEERQPRHAEHPDFVRTPSPPRPPSPPEPVNWGGSARESAGGLDEEESPPASAPTEGQEQASEVLRALERGELTVEEAMARLEEAS